MRALITGIILLFFTPLFAQRDTRDFTPSDSVERSPEETPFQKSDSVVEPGAIFLWDETWIAPDVELYIDKRVCIPAGEALTLYDCALTLGPNGKIICHGDVRIRNCTVVGTGRGNSGFQFLGESTQIEGCTFRNFSLDSLRGDCPLKFAGTSTRLVEVLLEQIDAQAAMHFAGSAVEIEQLGIHTCTGDGLNLAFCSGYMKNIEVRNAGGAGIVFSGSSMRAMDVNTVDCSAMGVSIGEDSFLESLKWHARNCVLGIAVKDGSTLSLHSLPVFEACGKPIALYREKAIYEVGGTLLTNGLELQVDVERDAYSISK